MSGYQNFEEEEAGLYANSDFSTASASKGLRTVPDHRMMSFIAWLRHHYPQIGSVHDLNLQNLPILVRTFESVIGSPSNYTPEEWLTTLQKNVS